MRDDEASEKEGMKMREMREMKARRTRKKKTGMRDGNKARKRPIACSSSAGVELEGGMKKDRMDGWTGWQGGGGRRGEGWG